MSIDHVESIPNNVDLGRNKLLQSSLRDWQSKYRDWWREMGPVKSSDHDVYLRAPAGVDSDGSPRFGHVKIPDYRWGIFLAPPEPRRTIGFGAHGGLGAWTEVPVEYRATLRRIIVMQGDTEPASVEQQRHLGQTCPSLYDLRDLYQINVDEGRHLWAMVYLLHAYFGKDGRAESDALLQRRAGDPERPRILGAFNEQTPDWLSFFLFAALTDRDAKFQLAALAESGFDPLSRTCKLMLAEEAHNLHVGEAGVGRILQRTCEVMNEHRTGDPSILRSLGVIDVPTVQRYLDFHFSVTLDLFGAEVSSNASAFYAMGLKGRFEEGKIQDDHRLVDARYPILEPAGDSIVQRDVGAQQALNERLRDDFIVDCQAVVDRWNRILERAGSSDRLSLPHKGFHRKIGVFAGSRISPDGRVVSEAEWARREAEWLPTRADREHVASLQGRVTEPGKFASYIAPPARGVDGRPQDFEYVRFA